MVQLFWWPKAIFDLSIPAILAFLFAIVLGVLVRRCSPRRWCQDIEQIFRLGNRLLAFVGPRRCRPHCRI
jgi:hypothetical protein